MELFDDRRANFWLYELLTNVDSDDPPLPPPMRRESNERYCYFGLYPYTCAMIATKERIDHVKEGKYVIEEPIAGIKNKDFRVIKADVISKIYLICHYLELSGFTWEKDKNIITIDSENVLEIYVCDGMFYILAEPSPKTIKILDCLQIIFRYPASKY